MRQRRSAAAIVFLLSVIQASGCSGPASGHRSAGQTAADAGDDVVNLFTWADYIAPGTVASFERTTGIKVRVTIFETNETLESRMLTGHSGFDVVVPTAPFFQRQIRSGAYQTLDRSLLPHWTHLDPPSWPRWRSTTPGMPMGSSVPGGRMASATTSSGSPLFRRRARPTAGA